MTWQRVLVPSRGLAAAALALALAACGGGDPAPAADRAPGGAIATDTTRRGDSPGGDTAAASAGAPGQLSGDTTGQGPGPWASTAIHGNEAAETGEVAILRTVRTGRHEGFDRIVFEFDRHVPAYQIRYAEDPTACGSGDRVDAGAAVALEIDFRPAAAHDDDGRATVQERVTRPGLPAIRAARITCDFEAIVTWVLGLAQRGELRALELSSPPRLAVDVRHR